MAKQFKWFDGLAIGHPEIDNDHRKMIDLINVVSEAIETEDPVLCKDSFASFVDFSVYHFEREEAFLKKIAYPGLEAHTRYHHKLEVAARKTQKLCEASEGDALKKCFEELVEFLIDDILKGDIEFIPFMVENGIIAAKRPS